MTKNQLSCAIAGLLGFLTMPNLGGEVVVTTNSDTGLLSWRVEDAGLSLELMQLHPDFIRAIYGSKNFPEDLIEKMAGYCMYGTIVKNTSTKQVSYRVAEWRYRTAGGEERPVKTKSEWIEEWRKHGIRFAWSLLPDDQTFAVGDWNQGFTTIEAARDSNFDLTYTWKLGDEHHVRTLENIPCPPERLPVLEN